LEKAVPSGTDPLTLAELIDIALQNSPATQITWAQARVAAANYALTQSGDFPELSGSFYYERIRSGSPAGSTTLGSAIPTVSNQHGVNINYLEQWGPQFALTYTIFDFGQLRATSEAARQALYYADFTHNRAIQTLVQTITSDYYNYLYQRQLLEAYQANIETAQITLDAANLSLQTGVQSISDVLQAETQLLQNQIQWVSQQQQVKTALAQLLTDMGLPGNLSFEVEPLPTERPPKELLENADQVLAIALDKRPDLLAAEASLRSEEETLRAAQLDLLPTLTYSLNFGRTYFSGWVNDNYDFDSVISLNLPIFSGFSQVNTIKQARASVEQAKATLLQTELSVVQQVTTAHYNIRVSYDTLQYADDFLRAAQEEYTVTLSQYQAGTTDIINVVSAQSSLANARAQQASAIQQWFTSLSTLAYASGIIAYRPDIEPLILKTEGN
jgi:outer membrane protein TolC